MNCTIGEIKRTDTSRFQPYLWLVVPCLLVAVYVFPFDFNGLLDMPNHMARADIMRKCLLGSTDNICDAYIVKPIPITPFFADLSLMAFLSIFRPFFAEKMAIFCLLCLFITGWYLLYQRINSSINVGYLAGLSLVITNYLYNGYYAYLLSINLALFWLYFWWYVRDCKAIFSRIALGISLTMIFACHLAGFLFVFIVYIVYDIFKALQQNQKMRFLLQSFLKGAPILATFGGLSLYQLALWRGASRPSTDSVHVVYYKPMLKKVATLLYPFINYSVYLDVLVFASMLVVLACAIKIAQPGKLKRNFWAWIGIVFFILFALSPTAIGHLNDVDCRFLFIGYLSLFTVVGSVPKPRHVFSWAMSAVLLVGFLSTLYYKKEMNSELTKIHRVISLCDRGKRLVGFNSMRNYPFQSGSRVNPFPHFSSYYILNSGLFVSGLFNYKYFYSARDRALAVYSQFPAYKFNGIRDLNKDHLREIQENFDYVIVTGFESESQIRNYLTADMFPLMFRVDYIYLFTVNSVN